MNWQPIIAFASEHKESIGLFSLAMAVTMRPKLPWPFNRVDLLEWLYEWLRDGLLTFVSLRGPSHSEAQQNLERKVITDETGKITESTLKSSTSGTSEPLARSTETEPQPGPDGQKAQ